MSAASSPGGWAGRAALAHPASGVSRSTTGFTRGDLDTLLAASPAPAVSIFLPTDRRGREVRQGPIRLRNLIRAAGESLLSGGMSAAEADALLAPANGLLDDHDFWQFQDHGLALFLDATGMGAFRVPLSFAEQVVAGPGFYIRPVLPLLAADGRFQVLTVTAGKVRLFEASRYNLLEVRSNALPENLVEEMGPFDSGNDYENPVQASPVARPHTGSLNIGNAQVYGDSPAEWTKSRLVDFTRRVAAAVDERSAADPVPVVLVAGSEIGGHFSGFTTLGRLLVGVIETNPEAMDDEALHDAVYTVARPFLDAVRTEAIARFEALLGAGDARAVTGARDVLTAAEQGRVDTLLLPPEDHATGPDEPDTSGVAPAGSTHASGWPEPDLLDVAAVQTLRRGGSLHLHGEAGSPRSEVGAILRY